eukprot:jgi/Ulvmu1/5416/UM022_0211.1
MRGSMCTSRTVWRDCHISRSTRPQSRHRTDNWTPRSCACFDSEDSQQRPAPDSYKTWPATAPPPRRLLVGGLTGLAVVLGGNFGGATSALLGLDGGRVAASLNLDVIIPVNGYKRYIAGGTYEFIYPASWLEDVTLYRRRIERAEFQRGVEFRQLEDMERVAKGQSVVQPAVGFGPPASSGEENLSVVAAPSPGLVLKDLGTPEQVANFLLQVQLARPGSGKVAQLLACGSYVDANRAEYYRLEYQVRQEGADSWQRHNLAILCAKDGILYTFNAQCRESRWHNLGPLYAQAADSFRLRA